MAMISIDGVDLPAPSKYRLPNYDMDSEDTNRNELGYLQRDRIRSDVYKGEFEFIVNSSGLALIKSAISPAQFNATILTEVGPVTKVMYAGDRSVEMLKYNEDYNKIMWSISFNLIEY